MLTDQRLRNPERIDEFVYAARRLTQLQHERDSHRRGQRTQQVTRGVEHLPGRQLRQRGIAVLVVVVGLWRLPRGVGGNRFHYVRHDTCTIAHVNGVLFVSLVAATCE